ncbi:MAG TPA: SpoIIE family protein phosphatase [Bryobacteraceae bacterium]|jgi:sigma-B regulation protein RsbU (phosphoserine phosphatase)|nr:SpoIIE family protein phosphatase [Bryobacteraceae bacterium]
MWQASQTAKRLGASGIIFVVALALFVLFYLTGHGALLLLDIGVLIPVFIIVLVRAVRYVTRHSLWSLRNRLLFVYAMFGVVPFLLLFVLLTLTTWSFMSELAIYLATSALNRRLDGIQDALSYLRRVPDAQRRSIGGGIQQAFSIEFPDIRFYVRDPAGEYKWPEDSPDLDVPPAWHDVHGLLVYQRHFYGWAHASDAAHSFTVIAPLSDQLISNLVPNLGVIALVEAEDSSGNKGGPITVGSLSNENSDQFFNPFGGNIPKPVSRLDVPIELPATEAHYHLNDPNQIEKGMILWVHSRPSAVLHTVFSDTDFARGFVIDVLIGIAILFLFVEIAALLVGVSLSRRITGAVHALYEGTRQVMGGDFSHRIAVTNRDQLGDLARSFNQMTGHIERLLISEKERERLQAEIEIAREVQTQLYPRGSVPRAGLHLTARCDPARMVSGDYYDYALIQKNQLGFAIGDVAGKGISAALLMATIQAALRAQVSHAPPMIANDCASTPEINSAALVSSLNKQVFAHTSPEKYATFFFALYDDANSTLTYTNAGHLAPLLFRNGSVVPLDSNGTVIGAFANAKYDESCVTLECDDLLVCYTDGITEPENAYGEMFGEERLIALVKKHLHGDNDEIIRIVFEAVRSWTGVPELSDDMTLLLARKVEVT